jgi:hypothetical protein
MLSDSPSPPICLYDEILDELVELSICRFGRVPFTVRIVITDHVGNTHFSIGKAKYRLTPSIFLCNGQVGTISNLIGKLLRSVITILVITILTVLCWTFYPDQWRHCPRRVF